MAARKSVLYRFVVSRSRTHRACGTARLHLRVPRPSVMHAPKKVRPSLSIDDDSLHFLTHAPRPCPHAFGSSTFTPFLKTISLLSSTRYSRNSSGFRRRPLYVLSILIKPALVTRTIKLPVGRLVNNITFHVRADAFECHYGIVRPLEDVPELSRPMRTALCCL